MKNKLNRNDYYLKGYRFLLILRTNIAIIDMEIPTYEI